MTRKYTLVIEGKAGAYSAYVPELQTILVTGRTPREIETRAKKAIQLYWEHLEKDTSPRVIFRQVEVELPRIPNKVTRAAMLEAKDPARLKQVASFREFRGRL
jgi:predicted RNase H-like HicB family nuclease